MQKDLRLEEGIEAWIEQLDVPPVIRAGVPASFRVLYWKPDPCHKLLGFSATAGGGHARLKVALEAGQGPCITVIAKEQGQFEMIFPAAGEYQLEYLGTEGRVRLQIMVE